MPVSPVPQSPTLPAAHSVSCGWQIQRADGQVGFEIVLDPTEQTENNILQSHGARAFYEPDVSTLLVNVLRPGDVFVDVGANCGYFTLLAAALVGPGGHVLAFEPAPTCVARLRANVDRNRFKNVSIVDRVAAARSGEAKFYLNRDNQGGNALWDPGDFPGNEKSRANPNAIIASATTIDAEFTGRGLPVPKLIKVDTEGAEQLVLEGAMALLAERRVPFVVAELHEFGLAKLGCSQDSLRGMMAKWGYSTFGLYFSNALPKLVPPGSRIRSTFFVNILFATVETIAEYWPTAMLDPRNPS